MSSTHSISLCLVSYSSLSLHSGQLVKCNKREEQIHPVSSGGHVSNFSLRSSLDNIFDRVALRQNNSDSVWEQRGTRYSRKLIQTLRFTIPHLCLEFHSVFFYTETTALFGGVENSEIQPEIAESTNEITGNWLTEVWEGEGSVEVKGTISIVGLTGCPFFEFVGSMHKSKPSTRRTELVETNWGFNPSNVYETFENCISQFRQCFQKSMKIDDKHDIVYIEFICPI